MAVILHTPETVRRPAWVRDCGIVWVDGWTLCWQIKAFSASSQGSIAVVINNGFNLEEYFLYKWLLRNAFIHWHNFHLPNILDSMLKYLIKYHCMPLNVGQQKINIDILNIPNKVWLTWKDIQDIKLRKI